MKLLVITVISFFLAFIPEDQKQSAEATVLFPITQNGKWGYIDQTGKIVISPKFDSANDFSEGMARVKVSKKFGFIDRSGKLIVPARFDAAGHFSEGLARVMSDSKWGFINKSGRVVIPFKFGDASDFSDGAFVGTLQPLTQGNRKYRLVDRTGKFISPSNLNVISVFSEGLAMINGGEDGYEKGYVNKRWEIVIRPQYLNASPFHEGLAVVEIKGGESFIIDKAGKVVISGYAVYSGRFSANLIPFLRFDRKSDRSFYGFLDKSGAVVITPRFEYAENFSEGLALAKVKEKYGFIDLSGNFVIQPTFDNAESFSDGLAKVWIDGKLGYVDKTGKYVWEPTE